MIYGEIDDPKLITRFGELTVLNNWSRRHKEGLI